MEKVALTNVVFLSAVELNWIIFLETSAREKLSHKFTKAHYLQQYYKLIKVILHA